MKACLLSRLAVCEDVLQRDIEFTHIVFAESIFVPTYSLEEQALYTGNWQFDGLVPFWIERFGNSRRGPSSVSQSENKVLFPGLTLLQWSRITRLLTGSLVPFLSFGARFWP